MIEIKKLNKSFGDRKIFKNFNCKFEDGLITAIIGPSGCGKSTLLNIIGLLDADFDGELIYNDCNLSRIKEKQRDRYRRETINYLFQNYALIDDETVQENLLLALEYDKISKLEKIKRINKVLKHLNLNDYNNKKVFTLSGGEQQRVALARVMLKSGNVILADEPTGNLDDKNSNIVMNILKEFKDSGKTVIIVTHNNCIAKMCDQIIKL